MSKDPESVGKKGETTNVMSKMRNPEHFLYYHDYRKWYLRKERK